VQAVPGGEGNKKDSGKNTNVTETAKKPEMEEKKAFGESE
jgi:hypothetical protein